MAKSVLHIKVEHEFRIFLFDEEKGIATPNEYFHLEVNKGEQDLMFVSTKIEKWKYQFPYIIKEQDCDYKIILDLGSLERLSHLYRKAQSGIKEYQYELGNVWFGLNDYDQAVYWYRQSARQGYDSAQYYLGKCYADGKGVEQNWIEAANWFMESEKLSRCEIGRCYERGLGVEQNSCEAAKWYYSAAYDDYNKNAMRWLEGMARRGVADAQYYMGEINDSGCSGLSLESNENNAYFWYKEAAEQGHVDAQLKLGDRVKELNEKILWYKMAAEQGNWRGMACLGDCYMRKQEWGKATDWFQKALELGDDSDKSIRASLNYIQKQIEGRNSRAYYLFFDTETTGVLREYNAPASNVQNWPRLVQLSWILTDAQGKNISTGNYIVRPNGFIIPQATENIHGITTERAQREGMPLIEVISAFMRDANRATIFVGHNISFDQRIVGAELCRLGIKDTISTAKSICTMKSSTEYCSILIPSRPFDGYRYPRLQELHEKLFGTLFDNAHDAMADIKATKKCFFELKRLGIIK